MSKNWKFGNIGNDVTLAMETDGGAAGDVVPLANGMVAYLVTDPATADGPNAAGLETDYASARLVPCQGVVELEVTGADGAAVFVTVAAGAASYGTSGAGADAHVGHIVAPQGHTPKEDHAFVYLGTAGSVATS